MKRMICYARLMRLCASQAFDGGVAYVLGNYLLRLVRLVILLLVWRSLLPYGAAEGGMTLEQVLTYTLVSSIFSEQLDVVTPATTLFWEGSIVGRYTRPLPVAAQLVAETAGRWLPSLLLYALPMAALSPLLGVNVLPASPLRGAAFALSLALAVSLGFALDFLYAALSIRLQNASYMAYVVRGAVLNLFSGVLIPFALLPWGLGAALSLLPFGSVGSAPLTIYTGGGNAVELLLLQAAWNALLWPAAMAAFRRSQERMVCHGG